MAKAKSQPRWPRFVLDGNRVEARGVSATTTLLQYLRGPLGRCGTKEGCAEGDCGACTVVVGEPRDGRMRYSAINSCIRFVPTLDGKEVVTVESLRAPDGKLHPVQQAMVDCHASQCGFCTPGFVMSLFALYLHKERVTPDEAIEALAGNLCRCTGYRPIIEAATKMHALPAPDHWNRKGAYGNGRAKRVASIRNGAVAIPGFEAPRTLDDLAAAYAKRPDSLLLAGGTDIGLWVTKQLRDLPHIIYIGDVRKLDGITEAKEALEIGAAANLTDGYDAIVKRYPGIAEVAQRFGSPPVRNSGTLCGNLANGSPIGDSMPILIALGAAVVLRKAKVERVLPLESLYRGYRQTALERGEFIRAVRIPLPAPDQRIATYKVSKRFDQDISSVCAGISVRVIDGKISNARVAFGGMAATPKRARSAEAALEGRKWSPVAFESARAALAEDFAPIADLRASAEYRHRAAAALLKRFFLAHEPRRKGALRVEDLMAERA